MHIDIKFKISDFNFFPLLFFFLFWQTIPLTFTIGLSSSDFIFLLNQTVLKTKIILKLKCEGYSDETGISALKKYQKKS